MARRRYSPLPASPCHGARTGTCPVLAAWCRSGPVPLSPAPSPLSGDEAGGAALVLAVGAWPGSGPGVAAGPSEPAQRKAKHLECGKPYVADAKRKRVERVSHICRGERDNPAAHRDFRCCKVHPPSSAWFSLSPLLPPFLLSALRRRSKVSGVLFFERENFWGCPILLAAGPLRQWAQGRTSFGSLENGGPPSAPVYVEYTSL